MFTLIPPGFWLVLQVPDEVRCAWSWYCHRLASAGCQHAPPEVLQATGAAHWVVPQATVAACAAGAAARIGVIVKAIRKVTLMIERAFTSSLPFDDAYEGSAALDMAGPQALAPTVPHQGARGAR